MQTDDERANARRAAIAQMLMEQGAQPLETNQMAGGYVVPVQPLSAVAKIAQQLSGAFLAKRADQRGAELDKTRKSNESAAIGAYIQEPDRKKAAISAVANEMLPENVRNLAIKEATRADEQGAGGTPGQWFVPANSQPYTDEKTGFVGYRTPEGALVRSAPAISEYQQRMTSPERRGAIEAAIQARRGVKATDEQGREFYAPQGSLNPDFNYQDTMRNLIQTESSNNPNATSPVGAQGLTQIMPETAANPGYGVRPIDTSSIRDQVRGGSDYLLGLMDNYIKQGVPEADAYKQALAAYNQGPGNVERRGPGPGGARYAAKVMGQSPAEEAAAKAQAVIPAAIAEKQALNQVDIEKTQNEKTAAIKFGAEQAQPILDKIMEVLPQAPSGAASDYANKIKNAMGIESESSKAQIILDAQAAELTSKVPRAPGAQSDVELKWAQRQAGDLANPELPYQSRMAAAKYLYERNQKILRGDTVEPPPEAKQQSKAVPDGWTDAEEAAYQREILGGK